MKYENGGTANIFEFPEKLNIKIIDEGEINGISYKQK